MPPNSELNLVDVTLSLLQAGHLSVIEALSRIVGSNNYFLIGGQFSQKEREPKTTQYYDMGYKMWQHIQGPDDEFVLATPSINLAVCGALFGDLNNPAERSKRGEGLVDFPPPYYAAVRNLGTRTTRQNYIVYAAPELYNLARRAGDALEGNIDIVYAESFMRREYLRSIGYFDGVYASPAITETVGSVAITGRHLSRDIRPYDFAAAA